jgi:NitT/TauT family transport system substrate-binding protein
MRAYRRAYAWTVNTSARQVAEVEASFFPGIDRAVLSTAIATYQRLGCWTPQLEITRPAFDATLMVFKHMGLKNVGKHWYDALVVPPPDLAGLAAEHTIRLRRFTSSNDSETSG